MAKPFTIDLAGVKNVQKKWEKAPAKVAKATGAMLNEFAFGTRNASIEVIREKMTVRSPSFVSSSLIVSKAKGTLPIAGQQSEAGSQRRARFSGWEEQQLGKATSRTRTIMLAARRGSKKKRAAPKARLKPGADFPSPGGFGGNVGRMLGQLRSKRFKRPFIIHGAEGQRIKSGLYKFKGRKQDLVRLQTFKEKVQPKKIPWMTTATDRFFARFNMGALWRWNLKRFLRF